MEIIEHKTGKDKILEIVSDEIIIKTEQDALDLMVKAIYEQDSQKIIINKKNFSEDFFDLKTKLAGAVLQKFSNYQVRLAIIGDYSNDISKNFRDFIYESNKSKQILFLDDIDSALKELE